MLLLSEGGLMVLGSVGLQVPKGRVGGLHDPAANTEY